jgi:predicted glutamine amidotransferase
MCRLFCQFALASQGIAEPLRDGAFSLRVLSTRDPRRRQSDGWGVGWIEKDRPRVLKSAGAIYQEPARVTQAIRAVHSLTTLGHIRRASNPLHLPKKALSGVKHTQPFTHGPWLFCHNGTLSIPREVKAALGPWKRFVKSKNDSEVLFYWLLKTVAARRGSLAVRVKQSMRELNQIWQRCRATHPDLRYPMHGLNWLLTDGNQLLAFCYANPEGFKQGGALGHREQPYFALQYRVTRDGIDVASEAWDAESRWKTLGHGMLLVATRRQDLLRHRLFRVH